MTENERLEITKMSKEFAKGFKDMVPSISGSGWVIVDPLSGYLNACGIENTLNELPANDKHPQILIMTFKDGDRFIPAGGDMPHKGARNWMWLSPES